MQGEFIKIPLKCLEREVRYGVTLYAVDKARDPKVLSDVELARLLYRRLED